jgi:PTS system fructose-specific IIC component
LLERKLHVRLQDYAAPDLIALGVSAQDKPELLSKLVDLLLQSGRIRDSTGLMGELLKREQVMSTGIGGGIAIPHALTNDIDTLVLVFGRTAAPMDFQALDGNPVDLVFMLVGPKTASSVYVKLLARVSRLLQSEAFKDRLRHSPDAADIVEAFQAEAEYVQ